MSIVHQSARRGTASSTISVSVCCRSSDSGQHGAGLGQERERVLPLAVLGEVEERRDRGDDLAAGVSHGLGAERDDAVRAVGADDGDLTAGGRLARQRAVDELGVGAGDRTLGGAVPEQFLRALVREQLPARRGLRDDHAERQLAHEGRQPLVLAVGLLVERAVVEREAHAACDLRGQLRLIGVRRRRCAASRR